MSAENWYTPAKTILLTGAGFTKTFGGFLGSEMWSAILNQPEVQNDSKLRECLLQAENLNFETVYEDVLNSPNYSVGQRGALTSAIRRAYEEMDEVLKDSPSGLATACRYFVRLFADSENSQTRGFVFTLNQDLFIERFYSISDDHRSKMSIPGLTHPLWFQFSVELSDKFQVRLPDVESLMAYKSQFSTKGTGQFMYVKLHGSYGWLSQDGSDVMVIGHGKKGRIEKEPLLSWYLSLFKEVLSAGERNLVIIGYGFGDNHINEIIADAINDHGLRLHVICPMEPDEFKNRLLGIHGVNLKGIEYGSEIWDGIYGYYPNKVTHFYDGLSYSVFSPRGQQFIRNVGLS